MNIYLFVNLFTHHRPPALEGQKYGYGVSELPQVLAINFDADGVCYAAVEPAHCGQEELGSSNTIGKIRSY